MGGRKPLEEAPVAEGDPCTERENVLPRENLLQPEVLAEEASEEDASAPLLLFAGSKRFQQLVNAIPNKPASPARDVRHQTDGYMWQLQVTGTTQVNLFQG